MSRVRRGVLDGRGSAAALSIFLSFLAAWSWASMSSRPEEEGPLLLCIHVGGMLFSVFIAGSVAYRSPLLADRIAFGAVAGALLLAAMPAIPFTCSIAMLALKVVKSLMWSVAAAVSGAAFLLARTEVHGDD